MFNNDFNIFDIKTDTNNKWVERKEEVRFINLLWDLIERMVGGREFHRVGPEFLKALE